MLLTVNVAVKVRVILRLRTLFTVAAATRVRPVERCKAPVRLPVAAKVRSFSFDTETIPKNVTAPYKARFTDLTTCGTPVTAADSTRDNPRVTLTDTPVNTAMILLISLDTPGKTTRTMATVT